MAGVQGSALAIAVSNAGGLGSLPCAMLDVDAIRAELARIRDGTTRPFNLNFFCHRQPEPDAARERVWHQALSPNFAEHGIDASAIAAGPSRLPFSAELADVIEEFRPPVVSFHFGLPPDDLLDRVRRCGARILSSATTVDEARWLEARGVDAVIAQGVEAGGHRGLFLSADLQHTDGHLRPGAAGRAGGACARHRRRRNRGCQRCRRRDGAWRGRGASRHGVPVVPRGLDEPIPSCRAQERERASHGADQRLHRQAGAKHRQPAGARDGPDHDLAPEFPLAASAIAPLRAKAESLGSSDFSPLWAGQNTSGCQERPAAAITRELGGGVTFGSA